MWTGQRKDHTSLQSHEGTKPEPQPSLAVGRKWSLGMVECLPSMWSTRLAPERHKKNKPTSYCALVLLPGSVLWGTGHLPFTLEGKALLSAASLTWRCSSGTVTGPHLVCTAHSPVQYLCGSFSFRRYWFVAHCLWVSHTSKITKKERD